MSDVDVQAATGRAYDETGLGEVDADVSGSAIRRLGVFGGTFDPIHLGHLASAERVRDLMDLDLVLFLPAANPVFKRDQMVSPAEDRLAMCRLAVADNPAFSVSPLEIERGGDTYTIDTLNEMRRQFPESVELYFITGADAIMGIDRWYKADELARLAHFVAITRPGYRVNESHRQAIQNLGMDVSYLETPGLNISSSMVRERVVQGRSNRYLVPDAVLEYMNERNLYR